jgi:hypothetical protein
MKIEYAENPLASKVCLEASENAPGAEGKTIIDWLWMWKKYET